MKEEIKNIIEATSMGKLEKEAVINSLLNLHSVSTRAGDEDFDEVDCDHYEYQQMMDDADEKCHKGIGVENCHFCIFNKKLHGC